MSKPLMPFLRTSLVGCILLLSACASNKEPQNELSPYLEETRAIELQAIDALQLGNYQQANRLYGKAYDAYSAIDQIDDMARQLINKAQVFLLVEQYENAQSTISELGKLVKLYELKQYRDRWNLLNANLAISQQNYSAAIEFLDRIASAKQTSINQSVAVSRAIAQRLLGSTTDDLELLSLQLTSPLIAARLNRLRAEIAIANSTLNEAQNYIDDAKNAYRTATFAPGIAEALILESQLAAKRGNTEKELLLRERASKIFKRLGNYTALERYSLLDQ